jgi:hypothetical protein
MKTFVVAYTMGINSLATDLRVELQPVDVVLLVGDGGDEVSGLGHRLEALSDVIDAVAVSQKHLLFPFQTPENKL